MTRSCSGERYLAGTKVCFTQLHSCVYYISKYCTLCLVMQIDHGVCNFLSDKEGAAEKLVVVLDCRGTTAFKVGWSSLSLARVVMPAKPSSQIVHCQHGT